MGKKIIRFLGYKGSWKWACRQMDAGHIVYRATDTTRTAKYKLDEEGQRRIQCGFFNHIAYAHWKDAALFLDDFESTAWAIWDPPF